MQTLFDVLKEDHERVAKLLQRLKVESDRREKETLLSQLRTELEVHASAEELTIYSKLADYSETERVADGCEQDHADIRDRMQDLMAVDLDDAEDFDDAVTALEAAVLQHVEEEESEVFADMHRVFTKADVRFLKDEFLQAKQELQKEVAA